MRSYIDLSLIIHLKQSLVTYNIIATSFRFSSSDFYSRDSSLYLLLDFKISSSDWLTLVINCHIDSKKRATPPINHIGTLLFALSTRSRDLFQCIKSLKLLSNHFLSSLDYGTLYGSIFATNIINFIVASKLEIKTVSFSQYPQNTND